MSHYYKIIDEMKEYVDKCNPKALQSVYWFLRQANGEYGPSQAVTIPETDMKSIRDLIDRFKSDCSCQEHGVYESGYAKLREELREARTKIHTPKDKRKVG